MTHPGNPTHAPESDHASRLTVLLARSSMAILTFVTIVIISIVLFHPFIYEPIPDSDTRLRNAHDFFEMLFFVSGIVIMAISLAALLIARQHAEHAQQHAEFAGRHAENLAIQTGIAANASQAAAYSNLYEELMSDKIMGGFNSLSDIVDQYRATEEYGPTSIGLYTRLTIDLWQAHDDPRSTSIARLLATVEHVGLLVRRRYVQLDDVYFIFEGPLKDIDRFCREYLENGRNASPDRREWEHALWLLGRIVRHRPSADALLP